MHFSGDVGDAHGHAGRKRAQLLESLDPLERVCRERDPCGECLARVSVHADVLAKVSIAIGSIAAVPQEWNGRA